MSFYYHINYNDRVFHHAWWLGNYKLSVASGLALRFEFQRGESGDSETDCCLSLGLGLFSVYFTFPIPKRFLLKRKCVATWDGNREFYLVDGRRYGFYFYDWAFVWSWHAKVNESSSRDQWWMHQYIRIDDLFLGKTHYTEAQLLEAGDVWFKLGEKEFKMNHIAWKKREYFRSFIPFALWHRVHYSVEMKIDQPPMYGGKGENSWDCGDDGTYSLSAPWKGPLPRWDKAKELVPMAIQLYVDGALKYAKRYGGSNGERGIKASDQYEYIGAKP